MKFEELLKEKKTNTNQLSIKSGVLNSKISNLKLGKSDFKNIPVKNALKIAKALGMTIEEIVEFLEK